MDTLDLEKFNPKKAELLEIVSAYQGLEIKGVDDIKGFQVVDDARKDLKKKRVEIQNTGKALRADAVAFQKAVIKYEDDLVQIIEPLEKSLKEKQDKIGEEKESIARAVKLPGRKSKLAEIDFSMSDDEILKMEDLEFDQFVYNKKVLILQEKEKALKAEQEKVEQEKKLELARIEARKEAELRAELDKQKAIKEAEDRRVAEIKEAEDRKNKEIEDIKKNAEREKQALIDEQNKKEADRKEVERVAEEEKKRTAELELKKQADEKEEQLKIENHKKYKKFLSDNKYTETDDFTIIKNEKQIILYGKIATYNI